MESSANQFSGRYFCHICNTTITQTVTDFMCPTCNQGFIEKVSEGSSSASSSYTDRNSENGDEFGNFPMVLDNFLSNISNRVEVMLHQEGASQNANDGSSTSTNPPGAIPNYQPRRRARARINSHNINPEHLLTEFFNMTSRNGSDNGQVFLVSNPGDYAWGREGLDTIVTQLLNQMDSSGPPPLANDKIKELPFVKITEQQVSENVQCSVCWDSFRTCDNVRQLPCEHIYHDPCIVPWLQLHGTCPICRKLLSEESESRLGGFAQTGSLEALLSDVTRRLSTSRRSNTRCYRCNEFGHIARDCLATRWNRRSRSRGQQASHNRAGEWGSSSYETDWQPRHQFTQWGSEPSSAWGAASAPAETNGWGELASAPESTDASGCDAVTAGPDDVWGGQLSVSNRVWPVGENTTSFELCYDMGLPEDELEWTGFEYDYDYGYPSDSLSSDGEDLLLEGYDWVTNVNSSSTTYSTGNQNSRNSFKCYHCGEVGHVVRRCPLKSKSNNRARKKVRCNVCSKYGHESKDCWHAPQTEPTTSRNSCSVHSSLASKNRASSVRNRPPTPGRTFYRSAAVNGRNDQSSQSSYRSGYSRVDSGSDSATKSEYRNDSGSQSTAKSGGRQRDNSYNNRNAASNHPNWRGPSTSRQTFHRNVTCWNCYGSGHMARECPSCWNCGQSGHRARDCASSMTAHAHVQGQRSFCTVCGSVGHLNGECREVYEFENR